MIETVFEDGGVCTYAVPGLSTDERGDYRRELVPALRSLLPY